MAIESVKVSFHFDCRFDRDTTQLGMEKVDSRPKKRTEELHRLHKLVVLWQIYQHDSLHFTAIRHVPHRARSCEEE